MKSLLALLTVMLCSLNAFGQGAQYRPTPFANGFVQTVTSTGTAQTYLGMGSVTNNALLSATNQTFTGTNSFQSRMTLSDSDTLWNQTPLRVLYSAPTNIYISSLATSSVAAVEVNGAFNLLTPIFEGTLPAIGSNSLVYLAFTVVRPQANIGGGQFVAYVGTNTNYWGISGALLGTSRGVSAQTAVALLQANASHTSASGTVSFSSGTAAYFPVATNLAGNLSLPWEFRLGAYGNSQFTNCWLAGFQIIEHRRSP